MTIKKLECHDCGRDMTIKDQYDEIESEDIIHCPFCGSDNISVDGNSSK